MNKIKLLSKTILITLTATLLLTACSGLKVDEILKNDTPTYMNINRINQDSYVFIDKEELYVMSDDEGLANNAKMTVENTETVFVIIQQSNKTEDKAVAFIGLKQGKTKAHVVLENGQTKDFTISVG